MVSGLRVNASFGSNMIELQNAEGAFEMTSEGVNLELKGVLEVKADSSVKASGKFLLKIDTRENEPVVEIVGHEVVFEVLGQNFSGDFIFYKPKGGEPIVAKVENLDLEMGTEGQSQVKIRDGSSYVC